MPRFYFHLINDLDVPDEDGQEFASLAAAREHAIEQARFTLAETLKDEARANLSHRIIIEDEDGRPLATVRFGDAVEIEG